MGYTPLEEVNQAIYAWSYRQSEYEKAACSNHVGVTSFVKVDTKRRQTGKKVFASNED